jgi:uncharacterized RDD family membrane protein YckC
MYTIIGGDGKEYGPVTADQVRIWIAAGRANLETRARYLGKDDWKRLGDFQDFGGAAETGAPPVIAGGAPDAARASRLSRLAAMLVDSFIVCLCLIPFFSIVTRDALMSWATDRDFGVFTSLPGFWPAAILAGLACGALSIVQIVLLSMWGQTVGKKLCGVRIVRFADGGQAGFVRAWLLRSLVVSIIAQIPYVGALFAIADICFIFRADRRCLHDHIAGTVVVRAD